MTGIGRKSIFRFLKEKLHGGLLEDNESKFKNTMTAFERLSIEDIDKIRHLIHKEIAKFRKQKGAPRNQKIEAEYMSYGNVPFFIMLSVSGAFKKIFSFLIMTILR